MKRVTTSLSRDEKSDQQEQHGQHADAQAGDAGGAAEAARGIEKLAHRVYGPPKLRRREMCRQIKG